MIYPEKIQTPQAVAKHYNALDPFYRKLWGDHLHHGLWKRGNESIEEATEQLIELVAKHGQIKEMTRVCDVGCGYGATARFLAKTHKAYVTGLTLSAAQWQYAIALDPLSTNPQYLLGDFLHNNLPSASFDVVIAIESSEHMEDKLQFFKEIWRILKPGGRFVTCAWLATHQPSPWEVKYLLEPICREGRLPSMGSIQDYRDMMGTVGLSNIEFEDLSAAVKKTWSICTYRTLKAACTDPELRRYLLNKQASDRSFAKTVMRIWAAYNTKSMIYGLFSAVKT